MRPYLFALALLMAAMQAVADVDDDPLSSPQCRHDLELLAALEAATVAQDPKASAPRPAERDKGPRPEVVAAQRVAAQSCLGSRLDAPPQPPPQRIAQPLVFAPPAASAPPWLPRPSALPAQPPAPLQVSPLRSLTLCDASGCWVSDGTRLQRMGPTLLGPSGFCSAVAGVLNCP